MRLSDGRDVCPLRVTGIRAFQDVEKRKEDFIISMLDYCGHASF